MILVSWKGVERRCLSLVNALFSSPAPNSSLVICLYADAPNIDFFEMSCNFAAAPLNFLGLLRLLVEWRSVTQTFRSLFDYL